MAHPKLMSAGGLEGDLLTCGATHPDTASRLRQHIAEQAAEIERLKAEIKRLQGECAAYENVATAAEHDRKVLRAELARLKPVGSGWSAADEHAVRKALEESQSSRTPGIGAMTWMAFERLAAAARRDDANTLKPTGEVAKDVEILSKSIAWSDGCCGRPPCVDQGEDALSRLAAKAQGYEAMKAERDALKAESAARLALADMWKMRADTLEVERDAAVASRDALDAECSSAVRGADMLKEQLADAVADNAALRRVMVVIADGECDWCHRLHPDHDGGCKVFIALQNEHPGAVLLKEKQEQADTIKKLTRRAEEAEKWAKELADRLENRT